VAIAQKIWGQGRVTSWRNLTESNATRRMETGSSPASSSDFKPFLGGLVHDFSPHHGGAAYSGRISMWQSTVPALRLSGHSQSFLGRSLRKKFVGAVFAAEALGDAAGLPAGGLVTGALEGCDVSELTFNSPSTTTGGRWHRGGPKSGKFQKVSASP
jgi:hypothetical protein